MVRGPPVQKKNSNSNEFVYHTIAENLRIWKWHMAIAFHFSPSRLLTFMKFIHHHHHHWHYSHPFHSCVAAFQFLYHNFLASSSTPSNQCGLVANLIGWVHQYFNKLINPPKILIYHHHEFSAQGQVFHWKLRHKCCSSAQRQVFNRKLRNRGCSFTGMKTVATIPVLQCEREEKYICYLLLSLKCWMTTHTTHPPKWPNPSINKRKREKYTRAGPQSHTQKRNPILVEEQIGPICSV